MVRGMKKAIMALVIVMLALPALAQAEAVHYFKCADCHRSGLGLTDLNNNICLYCHKDTSGDWINNNSVAKTAQGRFVGDDASDAMNSHPGAPSQQTSHYWASSTETVPAAGAVPPTTYATILNGKYGLSRGKVICTRCHDPHLDQAVSPNLLKVANGADQLCKDCHVPWNVANTNASLTHPVGPTTLYSNFASDARFKPTVDNTLTTKGNIRLVAGEVSCTSCHSTHFTDSDATTDDGKAQSRTANVGYTTGLNTGDGKLLRSDGALKTVTPYNDANSTIQAQIRSNLCQACHTYKLHGNATDTGPQIGCLDCHSGHAYNGGTPNVFVLRRTTSTYAPRYGNTYTTGIDLMASITGKYTAPYAVTTNEVWSNKAVGISGYCEECHGDVQAAPILTKASGHNVDSGEACTTCHHHDGSGWVHSWQPDVSAATCGDCHGFPPHLSAAGNRLSGGTDGGYAFAKDEIAPGNDWDYLNDSGAYKLEGVTAHNTHAGYDATNFPNYYFVGSTGTENCNVCHGDNAGFNSLHRDTSRAASFRDVPFNSFSTVSGGPAPVYYTSGPASQIWNCDNVYCHTNGGPRDNAGVRTWVYNRTPDWDAAASAGGKDYIFLNANRCQFCHGNDVTSMAVAQKNNSQTHNKHLNKGYTCNVCHIATASSNTALQPGATNGKGGGTHVNSAINVGFDTGYNLGAANLTVGATPYTEANGTCSVYCHSDGKGNLTSTADWQVASSGACNTCHATTTISSGSHSRHVTDTTGPQLSCDKCHGTNAALGTHTGHVNGSIGVTAGVCTTCHAVDGAETVPVWGSPVTSECKTCHTGSITTAAGQIGATAAPAKALALSVGHGKTSGNYGQSGNVAANRDCVACHTTTVAGHFDGDALDKLLILGSSGFPAAYSTITDKNNYCGACHGTTPGNPAPSTKTGINAHQAKACIACHDPHGDSNIYMVLTSQTTQNAKDTTATGKFFGNVTFAALTGADSYDEDDGAAGGAGEANADDLCATCHTVAANTSHNNRDNSAVDHNQGTDCFSCHKTHTDATAPFGAGAGNACNSCHGNPPATAAHARHATVATHDLTEDRTDCAYCHTGAGSYTYDPSADQGASLNHSNAAGRKTILGTTVGYVVGDGSCTNACHASSVADGTWSDANGLNCNACHYAAAEPSASGANNTAAGTRKLSELSHNKHFDKDKTCSACHDVSYSPTITSVAGQGSHIDDFTTAGAADDGAAFVDMAAATPDEATVARALMTWTDAANTCANFGGGLALGCHATGTPDWDVAINDCVSCHTNETDATVNPTSGLHNFATAMRHDDTLQTGACVNCHDAASPSSLHINGTLNNSTTATYTFNANVISYAAATGCQAAGTCHSDGGDWNRKWAGAEDARPQATDNPATSTVCGNCHGTFNTGWRDVSTNHVNPYAGNDPTDGMSNHSVCETCHGWGNANYDANWGAPSANNGHGDGSITMNGPVGTGAGYNDLSGGCTAACHAESFALSTNSGWTANFGDFGAGASCDGCHGGTGEFTPDGIAYPDRAGKHSQHVQAIAIKLGGNTASNRNASCDYCHLNPGETGHNDNVSPANVDNIRRIVGGALDSNPVVNGAGTNYVTCSNIDCHFDMPRTPHWYTDDIAPAQVTLTAVAGPKPRSIKVSWNAPGDDNNIADTTPYLYDLRMGTDAATAQNFGLTTNYAGNLPAAYKQGYLSEAVIQNLNVGTTYYFSLKTRDMQGNWSTASAAVSAQPTADTLAPAFGGADKATKADSSQTVNLTWTPAEDHTMPITYKVWRKAESAGALDMDVDAPLLTGVKAHGIQLTSAAPDSLLNDTIYNFGVRACDANNNCDTNTQIVSATPTAEPLVTKTNHTYRTNGNLTLVKDGAAGTAVVGGTLPLVFTPSANNTYSVAYYVDSFAVYLDVGNSAATVRATLGYSTNGTNFTSLGVSKDVSTGSRSDRVYSFKLVDVAGKTIPSGQRLAIQLSEVTATGVKANYGSTAYRGDVTVAERIVNALPNNPNLSLTSNTNGIITVGWQNNGDGSDGLADTVHYDLFGSDDNGATYRYLIASDIPAATTSYPWNTQEAGISGSATVAVKLLPGDGYGHYTGAGTTVTGLSVNNSADNVAPGAISDLVARARPKSGSVNLTWTAPGDDGANNGRAKYYDIRYSTAAITEGNFASATQCVNEPSPDFGGEIQNFEVTGLTPGTTYYYAIKTYDEGGNASAISTAKAAGSDQAVGGPRCGMCHTTAPSIVESVGNHKLHGFTLNDCTKCHGAAVASYGLDHQDGLLKMGYGPGGPQQGIIAGNRIYYTNDGTPGGTVMYDDTDGFGGFGNGSYVSVGDLTDDGTCMNFGAMGVGGCHSAAGTDPDGAGSLPTYPTPTWTAVASLNCAACHGNPSRTTDSFYNRDFDATTANGGIVPDQVKGAPVIDNHGNYDLAAALEEDRKYIGQHEKHLNYSFRFSKGDSCNLCHAGNYSDVNDLDGRHANGEVNVKLDTVAAGPNATWTPGTATTAGTCSNMSPDSCHPSLATPKWDSAQSFDCRQCHGMGGVTPSHATDPTGAGFVDDGLGNCEWCHFGGHPRSDLGGTSLILANSSQVGINYRSGGIHLRKSIGGRAAQATEAQLCWSCHDANGISEWGTDTGNNNTSTAPPNGSNYNYGTVTTSNWTTATWSSSVANFAYKTGAIQSTHSTNELGTSAVTGSMEAYSETKDTVDKIRCSNCHDVHNLNKAPGDTMTGQPYLRGTWVRNPYPEDGAPWNKAYAVAVALYGAVPRAGGNEQGGYQIDQNNNYPTAGLSLATSAGLCTLCHGTNVDNMDKSTGEGLWVGTNGHSNATLGGTASSAVNIFGNGIGGRPTPSANGGGFDAADVFDMGLQVIVPQGTTIRAYGYRNRQGTGYVPQIGATQPYAYNAFTWGVTVDAGTTDVGYHAFTCSKCHNPHASRLPKLMITNCLDTRHNTWASVDGINPAQGSKQTSWTSTADNGEWTPTHNTAQNCHRYDSVNNVGGWNKVTPW